MRSGHLLTLTDLAERAGVSGQRISTLYRIGKTPRADRHDTDGWPLYRPSTAEKWITRGRAPGQTPPWWLTAPDTPLQPHTAAPITIPAMGSEHECLISIWGQDDYPCAVILIHHDSLLPSWTITDSFDAIEAWAAEHHPSYLPDRALWASILVEEWSTLIHGDWSEMSPRPIPGRPVVHAYTRTNPRRPWLRHLAPAPSVLDELIEPAVVAEALGRPVPLWPLAAFHIPQAAGALLRDALPYDAEYDPHRLVPMAEALATLERARTGVPTGAWHTCLTALAENTASQITARRSAYPTEPATPSLHAGYQRPDRDLVSALTLVPPPLTAAQAETVRAAAARHLAQIAHSTSSAERIETDRAILRTAHAALDDTELTGDDELHAAVALAHGQFLTGLALFDARVRVSDRRRHVTRVLHQLPDPDSPLGRYLPTVTWRGVGHTGPEPRRARSWRALLDTIHPHLVTAGGLDPAGNLLARIGPAEAPTEIRIQWPIGTWTRDQPAEPEADIVATLHDNTGWIFLEHPQGRLVPLALAPRSPGAGFRWGPDAHDGTTAPSIAHLVGNWQYPDPEPFRRWLDGQLAMADPRRGFTLPVSAVLARYHAHAGENLARLDEEPDSKTGQLDRPEPAP